MSSKADVTQIKLTEAVEAVESETKLDIKNPIWRIVIISLALGLVIFHLYTTIFGIFPALIQRSIHVGFALALCFALAPAKRSSSRSHVPWYDVIFILLSICTTIYILLVYDQILENPLLWVSSIDQLFSVILLLLIIEAGRRTVGWTFPIMVLFSILYAYFGPYFPGIWGHQGFSLSVILQSLYHSSNGIWGMMVGISATILSIFAIFGATLIAIGAGESFFKISQMLTGGSRGGSAKVSIASSALFGMISGSAVSNVVTTGNFTIPTMKKTGFSSPFAGAVEAVASTGGQLVPPVLGAAAFIMAQILGIEYSTIAIATIIPAFLYYFGAFIGVDLEARKLGLKSDKSSSWKDGFSIRSLALFVVPIGIFSYFLFTGYTPSLGGVWAIVAGLIVYMIFRPKTISGKSQKTTRKISVGISIASAKTVFQIAALLACAQIVVSLISMTGVGVKLSTFIIDFAQQNLFLGLVLTALVCIVLGMGLPTTAAYVIAASVLGPALIQLGLEPLVAHLFIFYFAIMSTITPPVCAAVFLAAGLADANWWKTAVNAMKLAVSAFVVPFAFVYSNSLLWMGPIADRIIATITAIGGVFFLTVASIGFLWKHIPIWIRLPLALAGILMVVPNLLYSIIGLIFGILLLFTHRVILKKKNSTQDEASFNAI
ncbi:TRAP transporter permease [Fredinandcohnia onubensis]|uniref:TRAP transporter permease n=1 Tax=Fredinandcohnia onubensis TaxID=1571209 RepID=UPI00211DD9ED|nr:TRAP transporter permease [Fredinandcohnia onubensis]